MRIKKKAEFIPFPQTLAYRMIFVSVFIVLFAYLTYRAIGSLYSDDLTMKIISFSLMAMAGAAVFYNMQLLKDARISPAAAKRMRRRS